MRHWEMRGALATSVAFCAAAMASPALAQTKSFDVPAQSAATGIPELARQADIQILVSESAVRGKTTRAVKGRMSADQAIRRLIAGTGLKIASSDGRTFTLSGTTAPRTPAGDSGVSFGGERENAPIATSDIVVTGSNLRGRPAAGTKVTVIDRAEIDKAGAATSQDVVLNIPQNYRGGANDGNVFANTNNFGGGYSPNLRGLGPGATLTLINGRRMPGSGFEGAFPDISDIPASLIERVEVVADGASAIYGSDAIAGVINFVLRDHFVGNETRLRVGTVTQGSMQEYQASQTFGKAWDNGHLVVSYEFYKRDRLPRTDKPYADNCDLTSHGGDNFCTVYSVPGNIEADGGYYAIPAGQDGRNLTPADLTFGEGNLFNTAPGNDILRGQTRHSLFALGELDLGAVTFSTELSYVNRHFRTLNGSLEPTLEVPSTNPFFVDPFGGSSSVYVDYNGAKDFGYAWSTGKIENIGAVLDVKADVAPSWQIDTYGSYHKSNGRNHISDNYIVDDAMQAALADPDPATAFNPFGDGGDNNPATLAKLTSDLTMFANSQIASGRISANGNLVELPGGPVRAALGGGYDWYSTTSYSASPQATFRALTTRQRHVESGFAEIGVPVFSELNSRPGMRELALTAAIRYENYSDFGSTTNPKFGIDWTPVEGLRLRGTWGTSFRAPDLTKLDEMNNLVFPLTISDPESPTGRTKTLFQFGSNSNLTQETAKTWSLGFDLAPARLSRFKASVTYFNTSYTNRITSAQASLGAVLTNPAWASVVTRNPSQEQIAAICNSVPISGLLAVDLATCLSTPYAAAVDARYVNAGRTRISGFDFDLSQSFNLDSRWTLELNGSATYMLHFDESATASVPTSDLLGTLGYPTSFRARGSIGLSSTDGNAATLFVNYTNAYHVTSAADSARIGSMTTLDLTLSHSFKGDAWTPLQGLTMTLSATNLFDTPPPFYNNPYGIAYDDQAADPTGRFVAFALIKNW